MYVSFRKLFNLYAGEEKRASLFAILAFIWSFGTFCGLILSEGMFLEHVGAQTLPQAYLAVAGIMFLLATVFLLALNKLSVPNFFVLILTSGIALYCITYSILSSLEHERWFWFAFRVFGSIFAMVIATCFWAFVDQYYDLQDAKRLFCLFNSATFLGDACAGGLISLGLDSLGVSGLLVVIIALLCCSIPLIYLIMRKVNPVLDESSEGIQTVEKHSMRSLFQKIMHSRFTLYLMLAYFVLQVLAIVTEYSYMDTFDRYFTGSDQALQGTISAEELKQNRLTEFLGTCSAWVSLANMLFGLFVYSRLVKKIGVNNILLVSPAFFLVIFIGWTINDLLFIAVLGLVAREGIVYTFDDNNFNLLITGVPGKVKNQIRIAVESFFEPAGMLISAIALLLIQQQSKWLGLCLSLIAITIMLILRSHYPKAIFYNLCENAIRFEKKAKEWLSGLNKKDRKEAEFLLLSHLKDLEESTQLLAYESLLKIEDSRILPRLLSQANRVSIPGKIKIIHFLSESVFAREGQVIERLERWRRMIPHPGLKSAIHFYLAKQGLLHPNRVISDLDSIHLGLKGAAIFTLKSATQLYSIEHLSIAAKELHNFLNSGNEEQICMGLKILGLEEDSSNCELLLPFLKHPSITVARQAARSFAQTAASTGSPFIPALLAQLNATNDAEIRINCLEALGRIGDSSAVTDIILSSGHFRPNERKYVETIIQKIGLRSVPILIALTKNVSLPDKCRLLAGKILGRLALPQLQANLYEIVGVEIDRAYFYFYHAHTITSYSKEDLSILENALQTGFYSVIDFIIQILGVAGSLEDSELLSHSLRSRNQKIHGHAIETLEKTSDPRIYNLLSPLVDDRPLDEKLRLYLKRNHPSLTLEELLNKMEHSSSVVDQIIALTFKARLNMPHWRNSLRKQMESNEEIFHHFAYELLET